jgi:hypothetical protein
MSIEELKRQFLVDGDVLKMRLEPIVSKALRHCKTDRNGQVLISNNNLSSKQQVILILAARAVASQLDSTISAEVTVAEIHRYTGLPENQVRARGNEAIKDKFAESPKPGSYRAVAHKIEVFIDGLPAPTENKKAVQA